MLSRDDLRCASAAAGLLVAFGVTAGCGRSHSTRTDGSARALPRPEKAQPLAVGEVVRASVTGDEPLICAHEGEPSRSEGPCRRFQLRIPEPGQLRVRLTWDNVLPISLELRTADGHELNAMCCHSPMDLAASIDAGGLYDLEVILLSDWGTPAREVFEMTASLKHTRPENTKP